MTDTHKILVVAPAWVGDTVMIQPFLAELARRYRHIDVLAPKATEAVLTRMAQVNRVFVLPVGHGQFDWAARRKMAQQLKQEHYACAYVLPNTWKSALIPWLAKIPVRVGWRGEWRYGLLSDVRILDKQQYPLMVQRFLALAYPRRAPLPAQIPEPQLLADGHKQTALMQRLGLDLQMPLLALCPGAEYGPAKQWPSSHYAEVAAHYRAKGFQVCLLGGPKDKAMTAAIQAASAQSCIDLAGQTSLTEVIDLLALAHAVVTNDSGLMHIAAALQRPIVAIYGSSAPSFTPPLTSTAKVLKPQNLACSPCFERTCRFGHYQCLLQTEAKQVITALDQLLERQACNA